MADHPTAETIDAYVRGTLPPAALVEIDDHLGWCAACRALADRDLADPASWPARLSLAHVTAHPSYEEWESYVDGGVSGADLEVLQTHLTDCASCAAEVGDLRTFKAALSMTQATAPHATGGFAWLSGLLRSPAFRFALPVGAIGLAAAIWTLTPRQAPPAGTIASPAPPSATPLPSSSSIASAGTGTQPGDPASSAIVARLRDGVGPVTLAADGDLRGVLPLDEAERSALVAALSDGRLPVADVLEDIAARPQTLMGTADAAPTFALHAPLSVVMESDRPQFSWAALPGASAYVVAVYDDTFNQAAESPAVEGLSWRPARALARGRVYTWQVRAQTPQGSVTAPRPPAAEARFAVLSAADAERIATLRREQPASHLRLFIASTQLGLLAAADEELRALERLEPASPVVTRLRERLTDMRR